MIYAVIFFLLLSNVHGTQPRRLQLPFHLVMLLEKLRIEKIKEFPNSTFFLLRKKHFKKNNRTNNTCYD